MSATSDRVPPARGIAPPGFRLPAATQPGDVVLQVADLERSLAFHRDALGLRELVREPGLAVLGVPDDARPWLTLRERPGARPVPRGGRPGLYHFALLLPTRANLGRFLRHAANLGLEVGSADHRFSEALYLVDPDGFTVEVYCDRPREGWTAHGAELDVATDPLDLRGVLAAGGEEAWRGMPAGTTIGHVHFHVGDLAQADAFYHVALGFDRMIWSLPGALFVAAGGYHHHVGLNTWAARRPPAGEDDARLLEWRLVLPRPDDVEAAAASLRAAGIEVREDGDARLASDPWGITVRLATQR